MTQTYTKGRNLIKTVTGILNKVIILWSYLHVQCIILLLLSLRLFIVRVRCKEWRRQMLEIYCTAEEVEIMTGSIHRRSQSFPWHIHYLFYKQLLEHPIEIQRGIIRFASAAFVLFTFSLHSVNYEYLHCGIHWFGIRDNPVIMDSNLQYDKNCPMARKMRRAVAKEQYKIVTETKISLFLYTASIKISICDT
jgi:hypothetical protein